MYNMHHFVSRRERRVPSPISYSDRCTAQAAISSVPEIQYECQNAKETLSVWLVGRQISCERGKKERSLTKLTTNWLLERKKQDKEEEVQPGGSVALEKYNVNDSDS